MNYLFRILLTVNATSWFVIIYAIKNQWTILGYSIWICGTIYLLIPVLLSLLSLFLFRFSGDDKLTDCTEFSLADNEFLPVYLGYFFLAVSIDRETTNNMTLLGFVMLRDEVRENVVLGMDLVKKAGIQTVMITGDNKETAVGIAKEIGLIDNPNDLIMTHDKLDMMTDEEIAVMLPKIRVIARAMPQDKSRLVNVAKGLNLVVGMTGDGVNDAPALKKADVGFAISEF